MPYDFLAESQLLNPEKVRVGDPPLTTPMCDEAREINRLADRLRHYRACKDPRCQLRASAAMALGGQLARAMKGTL